MRLLDLFAGRLGWSRAFLARGWEVVAIDLVVPPEILEGVKFIQADIRDLWYSPKCGFYMLGKYCQVLGFFDGITCSSPCEEFSVFGMKHFHPNPPDPKLGIELFYHAENICRQSGALCVMENVKHAQRFVGPAQNHCGSFYLWGNAVPAIMPQGITKAKWTMNMRGRPGNAAPECWMPAKRRSAILATIPPELSNCVADYFERLLEQRRTA